jgi:hypothetical protein
MDEVIYLVKFINFPVKQLHAKNYYEIGKKLEEMIVVYKSSPEWIVRQS